jgi:hypothetical protein
MVERKARMFRIKNIVASCLLFSHLFQPAYLCPSSVSHTLVFTSLALSRAREKIAYLDSIPSIQLPSTVLFLFFLSLFCVNTDTVLMSYNRFFLNSLITDSASCYGFHEEEEEEEEDEEGSDRLMCEILCCVSVAGYLTRAKDTINMPEFFLVFSIYQSTLVYWLSK